MPFVTETECVYCAVRSQSFYIIHTIFLFKLLCIPQSTSLLTKKYSDELHYFV